MNLLHYIQIMKIQTHLGPTCSQGMRREREKLSPYKSSATKMAITKILFCSPSKAGKQQAKQANQQTDAMHRCEQMNAERWKLVTIQERRGGVAKAVCMARTTACGLSNNYLPRLGCVKQEHLLSLWGLRLHYASLSIGRRGKTIPMTPTGQRSEQSSSSSCCMQQTLLWAMQSVFN